MQKTIIERDGGNRTVYLHYKEVKQQLSLNDNQLYIALSRGRTGDTWKCKQINGSWYFEYNSIPNRAPNFYRDQLPGLADLLGYNKPKEEIAEILSEKFERRIAQALNPDLSAEYRALGCSPEDAAQLMEAKVILDNLLVLTRTNQHILFGAAKIGDVYAAAITYVASRKLKGLNITNVLSLRRKVADYAATSPENRLQSLVHGQTNNQNAAIIGKQKIYHPETGEEMLFDVHLAVIYSLYLNTGFGNKLFKKTIHSEYEELMRENAITPLSYTTVCKRTNQFNMKALMSRERDGNKYFNDNFMPYVAAERLQLSNTLWAGDSSSTKLQYRVADGTTRALMMYRVFDVASQKLLGLTLYRGGDGERGEREETILHALEMAYKNAGVFACELITDNGGGHRKKSFETRAKMCFKKYTHITKGNSQENPAEMLIKGMNNIARKFFNWTKTSWGAHHVNNIGNTDNTNYDNLPDAEEAYIQALELVEAWNNRKCADGLTPNQRYELNKNKQAKPINEQTHRFVFGRKAEIDLSYMRGFVNIKHDYKVIKFTIPNYEETIEVLARKTGYKGTIDVHAYYNETGCDIYTTSDEFICHCPPTAKTHKSEFEAFDNSWANHNALAERKAAMLAKADELRDAVGESMQAVEYGLLTKFKNSVVKDSWEEMNTAMMPLNQEPKKAVSREPCAVSQEARAEMSIEERAEHEAYFGS